MSPAFLNGRVSVNKTVVRANLGPRCSGVLPPKGTTYIDPLRE